MTSKVIVLDLDETLVHAFDDLSTLRRSKILEDSDMIDLRRRVFLLDLVDPVDRRGKGRVEKFWAIKRPHLDEFLRFCFDYFDLVIVWSAGVRRYVDAVVNNIFKDIGKPYVVYAREQCVKDDRAVNHKPLRQMINNIKGLDKRMNLRNTLALDDRNSTYIDNPYNGIMIPVYSPQPNANALRTDERSLLELMDWLSRDEVVYSTDVGTLDKRYIFNDHLANMRPEYFSEVLHNENNDNKINKVSNENINALTTNKNKYKSVLIKQNTHRDGIVVNS